MKPDITSRSDIEKVVSIFYEKVRADKKIGFFFSEVIAVKWEKHLPLMCNFWESVLFYTGEYEGNPLAAHRNLSQKHPTSPEHFTRWLKLFNQTIDEMYKGENAAKMKKHAKGIAVVMLQKLNPV